MASGRPSYLGALRHRDFRLLSAAFVQSAMGDWAYNVALVVYVYEQTHSAAWVSAATLGRMIPVFIASPYGGVLAERFERIRLMIAADVVRFGLMVGLAVVCATDAPAWTAISLAGLNAVVGCVYAPATAAMTPQLLGEEELAAGNALTELINNIAIIAGPAVGAVVLALGDPSVVMALDACTFAISAVLLTQIRARSVPTDVTRDGGPLQQVTVGLKAIVGSSTALLLTGFVVVTTAMYGVDTVLFVFLSKDQLGTGADGYGYLLVALGVGGVIAATFVNRLEALPRLSMVLAAGMIAYTLPTLLLVWVHSPAAAFGVEVVRGIATLVVDVLAMTALQRSLPPELISRVFGVFWALIIAGLSLGAFVTPFALNALGLEATLWLDALVVPVAVVLLYPRLAALDRIAALTAEQVAPRVAVFEKLDIFSGAPRASLERLARAAEEVVYDTGTTLLHEGDPADHLLVLVEGKVDITAQGERGRKEKHIRFLTGPTYLGEIGLLQRIPRTATVVALQPSRVWRIDGQEFLDALSQTPMSARFVSGMSTRLRRTHPSQIVDIPVQREPDAAPAEADSVT